MKSPLLHVLGGGPCQLSTVRLAKSMGCCVLITDRFPERPAYAVADRHEVVDITDRSVTLAVASRYRIDDIICDATGVGMPTAAYVAEQLGLPGMGLQTALNFSNKGRMRRLCERAALKFLAYRLLENEDELAGFKHEVVLPVILKPVDSQSGRGVILVTERVITSLSPCHGAQPRGLCSARSRAAGHGKHRRRLHARWCDARPMYRQEDASSRATHGVGAHHLWRAPGRPILKVYHRGRPYRSLEA